MAVFMQIIDVSGDATYPSSAQVTIPFEPKSVTVINEDSTVTDDAYVSFNGTDDHGHLLGSTSIGYKHQRVKKLWLRRGAAGTPTTNVQVIAES